MLWTLHLRSECRVKHYTKQYTIKQTPAEAAFTVAAKKYKFEFVYLLGHRGTAPSYILSANTSLNDFSVSFFCAKLRFFPVGTAVLFYDYKEPILRIWLLDSKGIQAYSRTSLPRTQLESTINQLRRALNVEQLQASRAPRPRVASQREIPAPEQRSRGMQLHSALILKKLSIVQASLNLSSLLLPTPISHALLPVKRLIIVPVLGLGTVPFALLRPIKPSELLIDRMSICIAPSLFDISPRWEVAPQKFQSPLVVGNPTFNDPNWILPALPGAEREANAVAKMLGAKSLISSGLVPRSLLR